MVSRLIAILLALTVAACSSSRKDKSADTSSAESSAEFNGPDSPIVQRRLEARIENIKYQRGVTLITNLERIANYGELAIPLCLEGLKNEDAMTRMGCIWVLGRVKDTRVVVDVENMLDDEVDFVRYEAASQLGNLGSRKGYRTLVEGLSHERVEYRYKCFEALRGLTGHSYGYSHNAAPEIRAAAVEKWADWLQKVESEDV
jgi:HEAT repeat protein